MKHVDSLLQHYQRADKMMLIICYGLALYSLGLANWYSTWLEAIVIGLGSVVAITFIYYIARGTLVCRLAMASGFMVFTALHIHQAHGMIEMHFGVFALLAMLLLYRDWIPIIAAAATIAVHHFAFFYLQSQGVGIWVLASDSAHFGIILLHAAYVIVETGLLVWFALNLAREAEQSIELLSITASIIQEDYIDLTQRTSGKTPLLKQFDQYTADVESLASKVKGSAEVLSREGTGLAVITDQLQSATGRQQHETDLIATAVEQMTAAITEVSNNARQTAEASQLADTNAQEATETSQNTQNAVQQLANRVANAADTIASLNDKANKIGLILDVIRDVAEQTNLLALNAAIEAARAGEQGRGFAVVADEVRTLAKRTQESTAEIDQMIEQLQEGSQSAVNEIENSRNQAQSCVEFTQHALTVMERVSGATKDINHMNTFIATSAEEQSSVIAEISRNIINILDASRLAAEESSKAASSANILQDIAGNLNNLSRGFNVAK